MATLNIWYKKSLLQKNPVKNEQEEPKAHKEPRNRKQWSKKDETNDQARVQQRHKEPNTLVDKTPTLANSQQSIIQTINNSLEQRLLTVLQDRTLTNENIFAKIEV